MNIYIPKRDVSPLDEFSQVEKEFVELEKICAQGRSCHGNSAGLGILWNQA